MAKPYCCKEAQAAPVKHAVLFNDAPYRKNQTQ
jgi:hypothetical protein